MEPGSSGVDAELIRPLSELRRDDDGLFGGKSASLGELIAAEIPVPPGFALAAGAYRLFFEEAGLAAIVERELDGLDPDNLGALNAASETITSDLAARPVPAAIRDELAAAYEALGDDPPVAVRSSAIGEDSAHATFAGQQETYLWVRGADPVCDAVRDCWTSLYSAAAISYRLRLGAEAEAPAMGVAVQLMIDAAVSGVMFTCNPVSGDPSTLAVNASWGLGLAVVGGEVTPDEYRMSKVTGELLHRTVGRKHVEYAPGETGAVRRDVPAELAEAPCLDDAQLAALVEVGRRAERHFGAHQDIEWAIARDARDAAGLFLLQSRPVTAAKARGGTAAPRSALDLVMGTFGARRSEDS
jgi:pyruvate,water dikinase